MSGLHEARDHDYFCDGGLACNTSDMTLYGLAKNYWPEDEIFLLSVGTGYANEDDEPHSQYSSNVFGIVKSNMLDTILKAPNECRSLECCLLIDEDHYLRIEHPLPVHFDASLDKTDPDHLLVLKEIGKQWFQNDRSKLEQFLWGQIP